MSDIGDAHLTIAVIGASGHLARTKIFPALFALYCQDLLPESVRVVGMARSNMDTAAFRRTVAENLTCRYTPEANSCERLMKAFLARCEYAVTRYESPDDYAVLREALAEGGGDGNGNLLVYFAIPPPLFADVARALGGAKLARRGRAAPWTRVVIEKPFGRDRASSDELMAQLAEVFEEEQIYRIDHYLGKEVVQNMLVLRFANLIFEPLWNRNFIESVRIVWKEDSTIEARGGYFDEVGIIRDVVQNHLLQILALIAMEAPTRLDATHIRNAKVAALSLVPSPSPEDVVVGQYAGVTRGGVAVPGYRQDDTVPDDSRTPTYAAVALRVENARWDGVPFFVEAGKGMDERLNEVRIRFKPTPGGMFRRVSGGLTPNELVIRVQPDEAIYFTVVSKVPGLEMKLETRNLDMQYESAFVELIPDAYEDLLLDTLRGEKSLFIRGDELAAAWDIVTPVLHDIEARGIAPEPYDFGSGGPRAAAALASRLGLPAAPAAGAGS